MIIRPVHRRQWIAAGAALALCGTVAIAVARASDHQDTPFVELNPKTDMTDVYAFAGGRRPHRPGHGHPRLPDAGAGHRPGGGVVRPDLLYQFKIDTDGDAVEDKVIQVSFTGEGASQQVEVRGPIAPPVVGAMENTVADVTPAVTGAINTVLGTGGGMQVFAGPRDDPFFIDLEAAFCILPDRRPVQGALSSSCALSPSQPGTPFFFRNPGVNYVNGFNVNSIVIELPTSQIEGSAPGKVGIWGTISQ